MKRAVLKIEKDGVKIFEASLSNGIGLVYQDSEVEVYDQRLNIEYYTHLISYRGKLVAMLISSDTDVAEVNLFIKDGSLKAWFTTDEGDGDIIDAGLVQNMLGNTFKGFGELYDITTQEYEDMTLITMYTNMSPDGRSYKPNAKHLEWAYTQV